MEQCAACRGGVPGTGWRLYRGSKAMDAGGSGQPASAASTVLGEHDVQLQLLAAIEHAVRQERAPADVTPLLDQLVEYTDVHFHSEELMMRLYAFPQFGAHRDEHADLMAQVKAIRERFDEGDVTGLLELVQSLRDWLTRHMQGKDQGFVTFLERLPAQSD
ncbi:MAG: bacteriohemerythrin [Pirellulales bacterium]|nr:bacteriohemerythrin [Pirellulales bacterium]